MNSELGEKQKSNIEKLIKCKNGNIFNLKEN